MTDAERAAFLMDGTRTGKLATVRADGRPHVVPVWFILDGDDILFTTWHESMKCKNLRRDPRATLCVDDQTPPYSYVSIEGTVVMSDELDALVRAATAIGGRYMGADQAEAFGRRNGVPGELLVRLIPTKIISEVGVAE
jgi:PPOX class probable F420-dependent enzyme